VAGILEVLLRVDVLSIRWELSPMDSAKDFRDQASECLHLANLSRNEREAEALRNISASWSRLAGQIDRYTALLREQAHIVRK
jgi:hypothetical protein